mmetsp:Transcript_16290/g.19790  ORF Transcript_16290/g.19790 Transcript_16290/m.19790 type:complete len:139 (-) Transcript_16290:995-1411(-)
MKSDSRGKRTPWHCFTEVAKRRCKAYFKTQQNEKKAEKNALKFAASTFGNQWKEVSEYVYTKNHQQCWDQRFPLLHSCTPSQRYKRWTEEEDSLLVAANNAYGGQWQLLSRHIPGRSGQQCRERFQKLRRTKEAHINS